MNQIQNFAHFASAKKLESKGADLIVGIFNGGFIRPSLLSSLDKGQSTIDLINRSGIEYVCFGNNTTELRMYDLLKRFNGAKFKTLSSNTHRNQRALTPGSLTKDMLQLSPYEILEVKGSDNHTRHVTLTGFSNETSINNNPLMSTMVQRHFNTIKSTTYADLIIPLTHQIDQLDFELASMQTGFPLILGCSDNNNDDIHIDQENCQIFKSSNQKASIAVIDLVWQSPKSDQPVVTIQLKDLTDYPIDLEIANIIEKHKSILNHLVSVCSSLFIVVVYGSI